MATSEPKKMRLTNRLKRNITTDPAASTSSAICPAADPKGKMATSEPKKMRLTNRLTRNTTSDPAASTSVNIRRQGKRPFNQKKMAITPKAKRQVSSSIDGSLISSSSQKKRMVLTPRSQSTDLAKRQISARLDGSRISPSSQQKRMVLKPRSQREKSTHSASTTPSDHNATIDSGFLADLFPTLQMLGRDFGLPPSSTPKKGALHSTTGLEDFSNIFNGSILDPDISADVSQLNADQQVHNIKIDVIIKKYKFQRTKCQEVGQFELSFCDSETGLQQLWNICVEYIKREVKVGDQENDVEWVSAATPTVNDIDRFVTFNTCRKAYSPSNFFAKPANYGGEQAFKVCVYRYGLNLGTLKEFAWVEKKLLLPEDKDRAGAPDNVALSQMVLSLKTKFANQFRALEINWSQWADQALRIGLLERDAFISKGPPGEILHMFHPVPHQEAAAALKEYNEKIALATNVNNTIMQYTQDITEDCRAAYRAVDQVEKRVAALRATTVAYASVLFETARTVPVQETAVSRSYLEKVQDLNDSDHRIDPPPTGEHDDVE